MKPTVLITRPAEETHDLASAVKSLGYETAREPIFTVETLPQNFSGTPDAIVATSAQAFRIEYPAAWKNSPLFVMGQASADRAAQSGFSDIQSSEGDFSRLINLIEKKIPSGKNIFYLRGETVRHDMTGQLSGYPVSELIVYKTTPITELSAITQSLLRAGEIHIVTLFSPRSAAIFSELLEASGLIEACKDIKLLCLSSTVLESVASFPWKAVGIAAKADQQGMMDVLRDWIGFETHA